MITRKQIITAFPYVLLLLWMGELLKSDAYRMPYLLIFGAALLCMWNNRKEAAYEKPLLQKREKRLLWIFSILFSACVTFANYKLYTLQPDDNKWKLLYYAFVFLVLFGGSLTAFGSILLRLTVHSDRLSWQPEEKSGRPAIVFLAVFLPIVLINTTILILCKYPGTVTNDSIWQITQILTDDYSNHHPFYHTLLIRCFLNLGLRLSDDNINFAVALYNCFQIVFMAGCFAFTAMTMRQAGIPKAPVILSALFYIVMPYHIMYSFSIWKDVLFGGFVLLFLLSFFRLLRGIGSRPAGLLLFAAAGLGICLFRSNGFFVYLLTALLFALLWKKEQKAMLAVMVLVLCGAYVLKHPVLEKLQVSQPDTVEALSIPLQQVAGAISEGCELTEEDRELISHLARPASLGSVYESGLSDPVKNLIRRDGDLTYFSAHKLEYLKLYIRLGLRNPGAYLRAWVEMTKGYWNSGYDYWQWDERVFNNDIGIHRVTRSTILNQLLDEYLHLFTETPFCLLFVSIGLCVWLHLAMLYVGLLRKERIGAFLPVPQLLIVLSLLIATPVYSEFRYVYSLWCCVPAVLILPLCPQTKSVSK